jgi:hypothetical protein
MYTWSYRPYLTRDTALSVTTCCRDLSLNNVMISGLHGPLQLPSIKLIDFGLCEVRGWSLTGTGRLLRLLARKG